MPDSATSPFSRTMHLVGGLEREHRVLLHEQQAQTVTAQPLQRLGDELDQLGRQPHRGLVEQHQHRPGHQRPADGEHLLLPARQRSGQPGAHLREHREQLVDLVERLPGLSVPAARVSAEHQVLLHGQPGEDMAALRARTRCRAAPCRGRATLDRSRSPNRTSPPARGTSPIRARRVEVLPAPFAPIRPTECPGSTVKLTERTADTPPYLTARLLTASAGARAGCELLHGASVRCGAGIGSADLPR